MLSESHKLLSHLRMPPGVSMVNQPKRQSSGADDIIEHIDALYSYALVLTPNRSDGEDLVLETYVRAIAAIDRLRKDSNVKRWLFTILRNIWLNQRRQSPNALQVTGTNIDQYPAGAAGGAQRDPDSSVVSRMDQEKVRQAIQQLPIDFREIIFLRECEGLSYQDIADVLKCPMGTVMSRLGRARSKLRTLLSPTLRTPDS